jgi:REP element-mobilizing transposase RayT
MSEKFQNKYRIPSARLKNWDYGANGAYFITICTQNRNHFFGEIVKTQFIASEMGTLAEKYWMEIPHHFPFVELGNFVVMPNHVHGILIIDKNGVDDIDVSVNDVSVNGVSVNGVSVNDVSVNDVSVNDVSVNDVSVNDVSVNDVSVNDVSVNDVSVNDVSVKTRLIASLPITNPIPPSKMGGITGKNNPMIQDNISRIIRWYKGRCSFEMRKIHADFGWQTRFHDHIIRNSQEFERIQQYIENNPLNWKEDKFHGKN